MFDPRWLDAAREWLQDNELPETLVERYAPVLAQELQDTAENFDVADLEREREDAAYGAHIHRLIDEARGK